MPQFLIRPCGWKCFGKDTLHPDYVSFRDSVGRRSQLSPPSTGTIRVASSSQTWLDAMIASTAGDTILIAPGTHDWGEINVTSGVIIKPQSLQPIFTGTHKFLVQAPDVRIHGLRFTGTDATQLRIIEIEATALRSKVTSCEFVSFGVSHTEANIGIWVRANDCEVSDNYFDSPGPLTFGIAINFASTSGALRAHVHHNTLSNSGGLPIGGGGPPIAVGINAAVTNAIVEYNYISNWNQDPETLEIKSSGNIIRYNFAENLTIDEHMSNRIGHDNLWYANWFEGTNPGWRVAGSRNIFAYNYTSAPVNNSAAVALFNGTTGGELTAKDNVIRGNVFDQYDYLAYTVTQNGTFTEGANGNVFADNYFVDPARVIEASDAYIDASGQWPHATFAANNTIDANVSLVTVNGHAIFNKSPISIAANGSVLPEPSWWRCVVT